MSIKITSPVLHLTVRGKAIDLKASDVSPENIKKIDFRYEEDFWGNPLSIGTIEALPEFILDAFQVEVDLSDIKTQVETAKDLPVIGKLIEALLTSELLLTTLIVSPAKGEYEVGIGLKSTEGNELAVGALKINGFSIGIRIETTPAA